MGMVTSLSQTVERPSDPRAGKSVIAADFLRSYPTLVEKLGGDPNALLRDVGLRPDMLVDPTAPISLSAMGRLLELSATTLNCQDFGLRLAELQGGRSFEPLDRLVCNAPTLGDALRYSVAHMQAYGSGVDSDLERTADPNMHFLRVEFPEGIKGRRHLVEQFALLAHNGVIRLTRGKARAREIWFQHERAAGVGTYACRFAVPVKFGQDLDGLFFSQSDIQAEVIDRNDHVFAKEQAIIERKFPVRETPLEMRVQRAIELAFVEGVCSRERVAEYLQMHVRTLHRKLTENGTSFQEIRDRVRRRLALRYLARADLPLMVVTARLGYSETPVLTRVCRRWFGETPSELRRKLISSHPAN